MTDEHYDNYINDGPFFEKYPDIYPEVKRYERYEYSTDNRYGPLLEVWERDANGRMVDVTAREKAREAVEQAQKEVARYNDILREDAKGQT